MLKTHKTDLALTLQADDFAFLKSSVPFAYETTHSLLASRELAIEIREDFKKFLAVSPEMQVLMDGPANEVLEAASVPTTKPTAQPKRSLKRTATRKGAQLRQ